MCYNEKKKTSMREKFQQMDNQHSPQPEPFLSDESTVSQPDLFTGTSTVIAEPPDPQAIPYPPLVRTHPLTDQSSVSACFIPYQQDLQLRGKSEYTITCFLSDLRMLSEFVGRDTPVGRITKEQLTDWLVKLKFGKGRDKMPAPKTMARRVTFLKNFFFDADLSHIMQHGCKPQLTHLRGRENDLPQRPRLRAIDGFRQVHGVVRYAHAMARCHRIASFDRRHTCFDETFNQLFLLFQQEAVFNRQRRLSCNDGEEPLVPLIEIR